MAIFAKKEEVKKKAKVVETEVAVVKAPSTKPHADLSHIVLHPRVTEKSSQEAEKNIYVFSIAHSATKATVASSIKEMYKVTPTKVNIVFTPAKKVFVRGKVGMKTRVKKAYVFLKKGDKIEFV
ncbi:MAG: 50S ribosomal protein L23 [Candidatus Pacebacteria bacterium]|nr:50S ribosomal protein L23 [Candidatus Paceibacterota bacterium]MDD5357264.1 50S ribosomal protein L23 [Candidatus Paceibacterota bacterium]